MCRIGLLFPVPLPLAVSTIWQVFIDSVIVRAHQHTTSAKETGPQALGCSRGSLTIKLLFAVDASAVVDVKHECSVDGSKFEMILGFRCRAWKVID